MCPTDSGLVKRKPPQSGGGQTVEVKASPQEITARGLPQHAEGMIAECLVIATSIL